MYQAFKSERTQPSYVRAVRARSEHFRQSPDLITEAERRQYFLCLKNDKHYSRSSMTLHTHEVPHDSLKRQVGSVMRQVRSLGAVSVAVRQD